MKLYDTETIPEYEKTNGRIIFREKISNTIDGIVVIEDATTVPHDFFCSDMLEFALRSKEDSAYKKYAYIACVNSFVRYCGS